MEDLRSDGHTISFVNLGGGLGIPYRWDQEDPPLPNDYAEIVTALSNRLGAKLLFEPGRVITGNAGMLVTEVIYTKRGGAEALHHRRRWHERSDPAHALRRVS